MSGDDVHLLLGGYAVGALDPDEERVFAEHLERCETCAAELPGLLATAARLGAAERVDPPARLRERVLAQAAATRQDPPRLPAVVPLARPARLRRALLAAAAVVLLGTTSGLGVVALRLGDEAERARRDAATVASVLAAPDAELTAADAMVGGRGVVVRSESRGTAVFLASGLPPLPGDRTYQLWYVGSGDPVPAGLLEGDGPAEIDPSPDTRLVAVTVEPAGGSPAPTTAPLLAVPLEA